MSMGNEPAYPLVRPDPHSQNDELRALLRDLRERQNDDDASGDEVEAYGYAADRLQRVLTPAAVAGEAVDRERVAQLIAHRACCGTEHDPLNGKLHGYCVVCGVDWPCEYAGKPPTTTAPVVAGEAVREALRVAHSHLDMAALRISHCKDAAIIDRALATAGDSAVGEGEPTAEAWAIVRPDGVTIHPESVRGSEHGSQWAIGAWTRMQADGFTCRRVRITALPTPPAAQGAK